MRGQHITGQEGRLRHSRNLIDREEKEEQISAGLSIEGAGLVARNIELDVFLVHPFVAIHAILLRIVIHGVVPPVKQGMVLRSIDRIAIATARIVLDYSARHVIDLAITFE
jgi:hypothetical protein